MRFILFAILSTSFGNIITFGIIEGEWGGHTAFGVDPISVASCLHSISWTNGWILTKLAQTHYWEGGKKLLNLSDLEFIFKVTPALWSFQIWPKKACLHSLLNQWMDSGQISYIGTLGWSKNLIRFWWPWPNFQGHQTLKFWPKKLVCTLYLEPNFIYCNTGLV